MNQALFAAHSPSRAMMRRAVLRTDEGEIPIAMRSLRATVDDDGNLRRVAIVSPDAGLLASLRRGIRGVLVVALRPVMPDMPPPAEHDYGRVMVLSCVPTSAGLKHIVDVTATFMPALLMDLPEGLR